MRTTTVPDDRIAIIRGATGAHVEGLHGYVGVINDWIASVATPREAERSLAAGVPMFKVARRDRGRCCLGVTRRLRALAGRDRTHAPRSPGPLRHRRRMRRRGGWAPDSSDPIRPTLDAVGRNERSAHPVQALGVEVALIDIMLGAVRQSRHVRIAQFPHHPGWRAENQ